MKNNLTELLLPNVIGIAQEAGNIIMTYYKRKIVSAKKADSSPITEADVSAHNHIMKSLKKISDLPCISEESSDHREDFNEIQLSDRFWIIDPLDGTKEFINNNDEFTVNIALIEKNKPILGVIYCPALKLLYYATNSTAAYKKVEQNQAIRINVAPLPNKNETWKIVGSRYHGNNKLNEFAQQLKNVEIIPTGSSLKFCYIADGTAHLYPRLAPTCEWDTAAGQLIVEMAGGEVIKSNLTSLDYKKSQSFLNPYFIAISQKANKTVKKIISKYE